MALSRESLPLQEAPRPFSGSTGRSGIRWSVPALIAAASLVLLIPLSAWLSLLDPLPLRELMQPWPVPWALVTAGILTATLLAVPLLWVTISDVVDIFALTLTQNALLIAGYFFLWTTAWRLEGIGASVAAAGSLVVFINAVGFAVLFAALGLAYSILTLNGARIGALPAHPRECDERLSWLLRVSGMAVGLTLALPMAVTGTIPLLSADPVEARFRMVSSDSARALYHAGTAVLPFITGGLLNLIFRQPIRLLGVDGWIAGSILMIQILTSNRLPIAITLFVTLCLVTLEKKWPRWLLVATFAGFFLFFALLTGLTSILRQDKDKLEEGNVVTTSLTEAFLGDNLIDLRDAAWVFSEWDFDPLLGKTYLGGMAAFLPSGVFPMKKEWHLGITGVRIVGWDPEDHFGLRITFFGEAFLNFSLPGVVGLGIVMGTAFGLLLRTLHGLSRKDPPCLHANLRCVMLMQMCLPLSNTSDAFTFWAILAFLGLQWVAVDLLACGNTRPLHA